MNSFNVICKQWDNGTIVQENTAGVIGATALAGGTLLGGYHWGKNSQRNIYNRDPAIAAAEIGHVGRTQAAAGFYKGMSERGGAYMTPVMNADSKNGWTSDGGRTWNHIPQEVTPSHRFMENPNKPGGVLLKQSTKTGKDGSITMTGKPVNVRTVKSTNRGIGAKTVTGTYYTD